MSNLEGVMFHFVFTHSVIENCPPHFQSSNSSTKSYCDLLCFSEMRSSIGTDRKISFTEENEDAQERSTFKECGYSCFLTGKYTLSFLVICHELFSFVSLSVFYSVSSFQ